MRRVVPIAVAALAGCVIAWILWTRLDPGPAQERAEARHKVVKEAVERGVEELASVPVASIEKLSETDLAHLLARAELTSPMPEGTTAKEDLLREAAEFLQVRFVNPERAAYEAWREKKGYTRRAKADVISYMGLYYENYYKEPPPPSQSIEWVFTKCWESQVEGKDPRATITSIGSDASGLVVAFGELTPSKRSRSATIERPPKSAPPAMWKFAKGSSSPSWWDSQPGENELKRRDQALQYAEVGFLAEFANGSRKPVYLTFFWDRSARRWWLEYVSQYNMYEDSSVVIIW